MDTETKAAVAALPLQFNVKSRRHATEIAKVLRRASPAAAAAYMDKYEVRRAIEQAACDDERGVKY